MEPQKIKQQKKNTQIDLDFDLNQLFTSEDKQQMKEFIIKKLKPISIKYQKQFIQKLSRFSMDRYWQNCTQKSVKLLLQDISKINRILKDLQISSPVVDWLNIEFIRNLQIVKQRKLLTNEQLVDLWVLFPYRNLQYFLSQLQLFDEYRNQNEDKFVKMLQGLIQDNKVQQCCLYYSLYRPLPQFQKEFLVPKLVISDQLYTSSILKLLKEREQIKNYLIDNIDLAKAVIILEHLQEDPRKYKNVEKFILRKHYLSMVHSYDEWYVFEDKMCFNPIFLEWYCEEQNISDDVKESMRVRNGLKEGGKETVMNPLFERDDFGPAEEIFADLGLLKQNKNEEKQQNVNNQYANLKEYKISEKQVFFIDNCHSENYKIMTEKLRECDYVGFDAEYRCTSTKYEQTGVSIIQISTGKEVFLLDFISLEKQEIFCTFFKELLSNPEFFIVGHSVSSDLKYIEKTMKIDTVEGVVDIAKIFKQKFPNEKQSSLAFMTTFLTGKLLSKYEQRSNWNRRPLKRSQSHYAALDAQICLALYQKLKQQDITYTQCEQKPQKEKKTIGNTVVRTQNLVYLESQEYMLSEKKPAFLVDTMLKKLCSLLRNLGIDSEYMPKNNFELMQEIASKEHRIILTRDKKLLAKKNHRMPIYCIIQKGDSDLMLQQIKNEFKIDYSLFSPLSRCVKCNNSNLERIQKQEAMKYLNFQYQDSTITEFLRCQKCKQIYWEGNQWKNAKKKFQSMQ